MTISTLTVFGTRPEAIKMAPLIKRLQGSDYFSNIVCVTGQHDVMLHDVLTAFDITPTIDLQVMQAGQPPAQLLSRMLMGLEPALNAIKPDVLLVHGDTTTTMAASLSAFYKKVPVVHIEAGLRTGDIYAPWPEEVNRKVTASIATLHFAPTSLARQNLLREGIMASQIHVTGNTVIDALFDCIHRIDTSPKLRNELEKRFSFLSTSRQMILVTGHRRESFGDGFQSICRALKELAHLFPSVDIVYPVHLNPSVQTPVYEHLGQINNVYLLEPVDYISFVYLMQSATLILTDSGGIQEEAPSLGKPVLVMRDKTERPEAIEAGTVRLVGTDEETIVQHVKALLTDEKLYAQMSQAVNPYGDGHAAPRIIKAMATYFSHPTVKQVPEGAISV